MSIGAIAFGQGRMSAAFSYLIAIAAYILFWWIGFIVIEFLFNVVITAILQIAFTALGATNLTYPVLDLMTPPDLVEWAITQFTPLWDIGSSVIWRFFEVVFFALALFFGVLGELSSTTPLGTPLSNLKGIFEAASATATTKMRH